jgi:hypothetical protein
MLVRTPAMTIEDIEIPEPFPVDESQLEAVAHAAPGGCVVHTSGNTLQLGTRWENYAAMRTAVHQFGTYPIHLA